jgi:hypothetical protein
LKKIADSLGVRLTGFAILSAKTSMKRSEGLAVVGRSSAEILINVGKFFNASAAKFGRITNAPGQVLPPVAARNAGSGRQDLPRPNFTGFAFAEFAVDFLAVPRGPGFDLTDCFGNLFDGWFLSMDDVS